MRRIGGAPHLNTLQALYPTPLSILSLHNLHLQSQNKKKNNN
jgi:hypothetical protein